MKTYFSLMVDLDLQGSASSGFFSVVNSPRYIFLNVFNRVLFLFKMERSFFGHPNELMGLGHLTGLSLIYISPPAEFM